jgi:UDP-3-O-[3-hydroxymyristoyl] glucosamine N-acyltransferase
MTYREQFTDLRPSEVKYDESGLIIREQLFISKVPRLEFVKALLEFETEETNTFETMPNGSRIQIDTKIGESVKIGQLCTIGGHGFGYERDENGWLIRMPHLSHTEIQDNVVIHNGVNIDRGVLSPTIIGAGTVIDSLVHIAHGAIIDHNCAIVSGAVIGGSVTIGEGTFIGMNACIKQKVKIGRGVTIGAGAVVVCDVPDGEIWIGNPARKLEKK